MPDIFGNYKYSRCIDTGQEVIGYVTGFVK